MPDKDLGPILQEKLTRHKRQFTTKQFYDPETFIHKPRNVEIAQNLFDWNLQLFDASND